MTPRCQFTLPRLIMILSFFLVFSFGLGVIDVEASAGNTQKGMLSISLSPITLPADGKTYNALFIQVWGLDESPQQSHEPLSVFLTSSNFRVAAVPEMVTIEAGATYTLVPVTVSAMPGATLFTGVAVGYVSADVELETFSPLGAEPPLHLEISALPPISSPGSTGILAVSLVDEDGIPFLAPSDTTVVLTSSVSGAIELPRTIVIPRSEYISKTEWRASKPGEVSIMAQADSVGSGKAWVSVSEHLLRGEPTVLAAYQLLPSLPARGMDLEVAVLQALDKDGNPTDFPCADVFVTSSAPDVVLAQSLLFPLPCDTSQIYTTFSASTTELAGDAVLSFGAAGLAQTDLALTTHGLEEVRIDLQYGPLLPMGTDVVPAIISLQLLDEEDRPVVFHKDYAITLLSEGTDLPTKVSIPSGDSFVSLPIARDVSESDISVAAASEGIEGTSISLEIEQRALEISLDISELTAGVDAEVTAKITSGDLPVLQAEVVWEVEEMFSEPVVTETDREGIARIILTPTDDSASLNIAVHASYPGYDSDTAISEVVILPPYDTAEDEASRLPFLAVFAMVGLVLAAYLAYDAGLPRKLIAFPPLSRFRRQSERAEWPG